MSITKRQKIALAVIVLSLIIGTGGMVWSVYGAFDGMATAENAGIGAVGDSIRNALIFMVVGLVGTLAGAVLLILGPTKAS